jgi:transposase
MLEEIHPHAAGIDIGSRKIFVALAGEEPCSFDTFTAGFEAAGAYLRERGVKTVAMEATGVYWVALYEVLEAAGMEVCVVNGAHARNLPGRKSDVSDSQWLAELHAHGLLRPSFVANEDVRRLRSFQRLRDDHIEMASMHVQHMHKALDLLNIKLQYVISQLTGASGLRVVRAILGGERCAQKLAALCDERILKVKREKVLLSLQGVWREEHLFALRQGLQGWEFYQGQMEACDRECQRILEEMSGCGRQPPSSGQQPQQPRRKEGRSGSRGSANSPQIEGLHSMLVTIMGGRDLSVLPGFAQHTLLRFVSEVGTDMSRWKSAAHFTSWLCLTPRKAQSGNRSRRVRGRPRTRAGQILRLIARTVGNSKYLALGGFYRRIRGRKSAAIANVATARKLGILFYNAMRHGFDYVERGLEDYERKFKERTISRLAYNAKKLGFALAPLQPAVP